MYAMELSGVHVGMRVIVTYTDRKREITTDPFEIYSITHNNGGSVRITKTSTTQYGVRNTLSINGDAEVIFVMGEGK